MLFKQFFNVQLVNVTKPKKNQIIYSKKLNFVGFSYLILDGWYNWHLQPFGQWWFFKHGLSKSHGFVQYPGGSPFWNPSNGKHFNHKFKIHLTGQQKHCFKQSKLLKHLQLSKRQPPEPLSDISVPKIVWIRRTTTKILIMMFRDDRYDLFNTE